MTDTDRNAALPELTMEQQERCRIIGSVDDWPIRLIYKAMREGIVLGRQEASGGAAPVGEVVDDWYGAAVVNWRPTPPPAGTLLYAAPVAPAPSEPSYSLGRPRQQERPCGGCHLKNGETCDICGASEPAARSDAQPVDERAARDARAIFESQLTDYACAVRDWHQQKRGPSSADVQTARDAVLAAYAALARSPAPQEAVIAGDRTTHWYACPHCSKPIDPPAPQEAAGKADGREAFVKAAAIAASTTIAFSHDETPPAVMGRLRAAIAQALIAAAPEVD